tara:strand:- start:4256 stop:4582 length:327 start_codon:yes stop_codon:yes gene_type:complete
MEVDQNVVKTIESQIKDNPILLYMKGSPQTPHCGFSAHASQAIMKCGVEFGYINILENPEIRSTLPKIAKWPTFPQLYVKGELIGGCDIILEMYETGELQDLLAEFKN